MGHTGRRIGVDSTLPADVPIKPPCRCVSVSAAGWGLSNRAYRRPLRRAAGRSRLDVEELRHHKRPAARLV
jgi:hypothetical protein